MGMKSIHDIAAQIAARRPEVDRLTVELADTADARRQDLKDVQEQMQMFEQEVRDRQDEDTATLARLQGAHSKAEAALRNAVLAGGEIISEVPLRYRQSVDQAGIAVRAHEAAMHSARRELQAAEDMMTRRQSDKVPLLGKDETTALQDQIDRARAGLTRVTTRWGELVEEHSRCESVVAAEVAKIRKQAK